MDLRKLIKVLLPVLVGILLYQTCFAEVIKVGVIASLTGPAAKDGQGLLEGIKLAESELNAPKKQINLIIEDDNSKANNVASAFAKLATIDKVDFVIGGTWDFLAETAFPLSDQYKVPFITPNNPVEILSDTFKKSKFSFTNGLSLEAEEKVLNDFLIYKKVKSIALAYVDVPYGISHADLAKDLASKLGINIVLDEKINYEAFIDSIKNIALKARLIKPDLVFLITNYEGTDIFHREINHLKLNPVIITAQALHEAVLLNPKAEYYKNSFGIFPKIINKAFSDKFFDQYKHQAFNHSGASYDALKFAVKCIKNLKNLSDKRCEYLGATGLHSLHSSNRQLVKNEAEILHFKNGNLETIVFN